MKQMLFSILVVTGMLSCNKTGPKPVPVETPQLVPNSCLESLLIVAKPSGDIFPTDYGCRCLWTYKDKAFIDFKQVSKSYCEADRARQNESE